MPTFISPRGNEVSTNDPTYEVRLRSQGYSVKESTPEPETEPALDQEDPPVFNFDTDRFTTDGNPYG